MEIISIQHQIQQTTTLHSINKTITSFQTTEITKTFTSITSINQIKTTHVINKMTSSSMIKEWSNLLSNSEEMISVQMSKETTSKTSKILHAQIKTL